jgi:hypothetical protein
MLASEAGVRSLHGQRFVTISVPENNQSLEAFSEYCTNQVALVRYVATENVDVLVQNLCFEATTCSPDTS